MYKKYHTHFSKKDGCLALTSSSVSIGGIGIIRNCSH